VETRHNLPQQLTSFIGREREIAEVKRLLATTRLLTLVGTGGGGKTRLSLQVAAELLDEFRDGVCFVGLAPISDSLLVVTTIAQALGIKEEGEQPLIDTLKVALREREALLVLDNFEQVIPAGPLVTDLLLSCPAVKVLITSREALHVYGEHEFQVPPLALPNPRKDPALATLSQSEAVQLFVQRARAVKHDFALTEANAPHVADVCIRLDGLPLAIELAAARVRVLPPQAIVARLGSALGLLTGGAQNLPERQQTLRSAIAWSYDLLDADEAALFRRLSVFVDGCSLDAAEWISEQEKPPRENSTNGTAASQTQNPKSKIQNPLDGISSLVDKSLLRQVEGPDGEPRFLMLETIREYALERLADSGDDETLRRAHAQYFLGLAEAAEPQMRGPQQVSWLERLEREHDNLRAALRWSIERGEDETALRLSAALPRFWFVRGYLSEGRRWLGEALQGAESNGKAAKSTTRTPQFESARARALNGAGLLAYPQGEYAVAHSLLEKSLALFRHLDDKQNIAYVLNGLGVVVQQQGDYTAARNYLEQSLALRRALGDKQGIASTLNNLGEVARCLGDYDAARSTYEEALAVLAEVGSKWDVASALHNLAYVAHRQKDYGQATALFIESLGWYRELGLKTGIAASVTGLAGVAAAAGMSVAGAERAARLFGAAERLREEVGAIVDRADLAEYERNVAEVRAQLNETAFAVAWTEGRAMSLDDALVYAQQEIAIAAQPAAVPEAVKKRKASASSTTQIAPDELTRREVEVLRLVADGLTNPQVSQRLFLSHRTVEAHLHSIFGKLGIATRGEAIRYAIERGIA
jgi:non-specific serine/threonine protein kinase